MSGRKSSNVKATSVGNRRKYTRTAIQKLAAKQLLWAKTHPAVRKAMLARKVAVRSLSQRLPLRGPTGSIIDDIGQFVEAIASGDWEKAIVTGIEQGPKLYNLAKEGFNKVKNLISPPSNSAVMKEEKAILKAEREIERKEGAVYGSRPFMNPVRPVSKRGRNSPICDGCEPLQSIVAPQGGYAAGQIIYSCLINPTTMGLPKLARTCKGYEHYKLSGAFMLKGSSGTSAVGTYAMYIDYDPDDEIPYAASGAVNVSRALGHSGVVVATPWEEASVSIKKRDELDFLFVDNDEGEARFTSLGRLYLICIQAIPADTQIGQLFFDWEIELSIPQEDPGVPVGDSYYVSSTNSSATNLLANPTYGKNNTIDVTWTQTWTGSDLKSCSSTSLVSTKANATTTGYFTIPPGSYQFTAVLNSAAVVLASEFGWEYSLGVQEWTPSKAYHIAADSKYHMCTGYFYSDKVWKMYSNLASVDAPTLSVRVYLQACNGSPWATTFKKTKELFDLAKEAKKQADKIKDLPPLYDEQSLSRTSSSVPKIKEDYVVVPRMSLRCP